MKPRFAFSLLAAVLVAVLGGCDAFDAGTPTGRSSAKPPIDPVMARALHDPLMSDPDLARRSEANAVLSYTDWGALPVLEAGQEAAREAREAALGELLAGGKIAALPPIEAASSRASIGELTDPAPILSAAGAPAGCLAGLREGFEWAANLPLPAAIMPLGMAEKAAGSDGAGCEVRLVRYLTAASIEDSLVYHHTLASRAGWKITRHAEPEAILAASGTANERLQVYLRAGQGGMNAIDLVYWVTP